MIGVKLFTKPPKTKKPAKASSFLSYLVITLSSLL